MRIGCAYDVAEFGEARDGLAHRSNGDAGVGAEFGDGLWPDLLEPEKDRQGRFPQFPARSLRTVPAVQLGDELAQFGP